MKDGNRKGTHQQHMAKMSVYERGMLFLCRATKKFEYGKRVAKKDFADYIRIGKYSNGNNGYGGLYRGHWGHSDDIQREIVDYAKKSGTYKAKVLNQTKTL